MPAVPSQDERWLARALDLARRGEGLTRPNPPVGAVVVCRGRLAGAGWHQAAGRPHAEILALRSAGRRARGGTLYVTLEPCSTSGRTPPCVPAIAAAGIRRVVFGARDPNPRHRGRGARWLRRLGIEVRAGVGAAAARALLAPFARWITAGRPYLTLKLGLTVDGKIADRHGCSRWITSPAARREVQALRRAADAILVGAGTARADNPALLPRPGRGRRPFRVIADARGRVPPGARLLTDTARQRTIIATTRRCPPARRRAWLDRGAQVWLLPAGRGGVSLPALLRRLGRLGVLHVLCEGGSELAASLVRAGLVDKYVFHVAPRILGGGVNALAGAGWPLAAAPELRFAGCRRLGPDLVLTAVPRRRGVRRGHRPPACLRPAIRKQAN